MLSSGLPIPGAGYPVPDGDNIYLEWNTWYMEYFFRMYPPLYDVSLQGL